MIIFTGVNLRTDPARRQLAEETRQWLQSIDPSGDLDKLRAEIIARILLLTAEKVACAASASPINKKL
jgi:hypothetical protein